MYAQRLLSSRLLSTSAGLRARATMERFIAQAAAVCVHCRRKAVITMLNERFVALYSDDTPHPAVTGCDGLANIFRSCGSRP